MQVLKLDARKSAQAIVMGISFVAAHLTVLPKDASAQELRAHDMGSLDMGSLNTGTQELSTKGLVATPFNSVEMAKRHQERMQAIRKARAERVAAYRKAQAERIAAYQKAQAERIAAYNKARQDALQQHQKRNELKKKLRAQIAKAKGNERVALQRKLYQVSFSHSAADLEINKLKKRKAAAKAKTRSKGSKLAGKSRYSALIAKHARAHGVPVALAHAVVFTESRFRANARGRAGEIGLMQIKPATARGMGYRGSAKGLYNPDTNLRYGMKYLARAHSLAGGSICGTILKYNAGHGAKRMNPVSRRYCNKVRRLLK